MSNTASSTHTRGNIGAANHPNLYVFPPVYSARYVLRQLSQSACDNSMSMDCVHSNRQMWTTSRNNNRKKFVTGVWYASRQKQNKTKQKTRASERARRMISKLTYVPMLLNCSNG